MHPAHLVNRWIGQTQQVAEGSAAHLVNEWMGHTQKVAEDHYIQDLPEDYIAAYNAEKNGGKTIGEHVGIVGTGVEIAQNCPIEFPPFHPTISGLCNATPYNSRDVENTPDRLGRT